MELLWNEYLCNINIKKYKNVSDKPVNHYFFCFGWLPYIDIFLFSIALMMSLLRSLPLWNCNLQMCKVFTPDFMLLQFYSILTMNYFHWISNGYKDVNLGWQIGNFAILHTVVLPKFASYKSKSSKSESFQSRKYWILNEKVSDESSLKISYNCVSFF